METTKVINGLKVSIEKKQSNFGSGKKTVYTGFFEKDGQTVRFENRAIDALNALCGVPRTSNGKRVIRINSVEEIETKSVTLINRVTGLLSKVDALLKDYTDMKVSFDSETLKVIEESIKNKMMDECRKEELRKREKEEKDAVNELTAKIKEALKLGNFSEVARLSALQAGKESSMA